jgi:uncharacterized protein (TIGR03663 family)
MRITRPALLLLIVIAALALRLPFLGERPMHNDEAVNGIKFGQLWEHGAYRYDPNEHHGPSLIYATDALAGLTRAPDLDHFSEARLRLVAVLFGVGLLLLLPLVADGLGRRATLWAALFTALSPAMVFYSRYYIHEIPFVFFAFLGLGAGWRYWRTRKIGWALVAGFGVGLMHATKETFVFNLVAVALALGLNQTWNRMLDASGLPVKAPRLNFIHVAAGLGVWVVVALLLFSSFLTNASGPLDSFRTYAPWFARAGGESPHIHPWHYYLHRLLFFHAGKGPVWTEAVILLLAGIGAVAAFLRKGLADANASFVRFLALYTVALTGAYSVISYKTPWCLLSFWHGMLLLAGVGTVVLVGRFKPPTSRLLAAAVVLVAAIHLGWQAWQLSVPLAADQRNPYVYAHTSPDILRLVQQVESLAKAAPEGHQMLVKVMAPDSDFWPLPWYLRAFKRTGWWEELPSDPFAPVMIVSAKFQAALDEKKTHLMVGIYQLRPGVFFELYVQLELWQTYLKQNPPKRDLE